jgi:hypothetical protein
VLGETLRAKRHQITIATKFGISAPRNRRFLALVRRIVMPAVRCVPAIKSRLSRAAGGLKARTRFSPDALRESIDASLVALRTDYIDVFLLHEATVADLSDELFDALEQSVKQGKIRTFGVGSEIAAADLIYRVDRRFCPIMQFEWSVLSGEKPTYSGSFLITHRSLSVNFTQLRAWLSSNPGVAQRWSHELGVDISGGSALSRLMLAAARNANPSGITLFSSRNAGNIRANARLTLDDAALQQAAVFAALVTRDARAILRPQIVTANKRAERVLT